MKKLLLLAIFSLILSQLTCIAQTITPVSEKDLGSELDSYIRKTLEAFPEIPSVAMVVVKDDKPIFMRAYGLVNKENSVKPDANTLYYIASSTKSYMALAAALLDREGKIKLDDPITKYARGVTFRNAVPDKVTVRDLLTHTSGLRNDPLTFRVAYSGEVDDKDLLRVFAETTSFDENSYGKYAYTNLGYNIYAMLVKLSLGKNWQDVLQEKVFGPIGLKQTSSYVSKMRAAKLTLADSYLYDPGSGTVVRSPIDKQDNNMQSAGGIVTSLNDLSRWLIANINNGKIDGKQAIPVDVMQMVHTGYTDTTRNQPPFTGNGKYGLGWQIGTYKNENVIYHFGGYPGWACHISYMPDKKIGVAVVANESTAGGRLVHQIAAFAYERLLGTDTVESYDKQLLDLSQRFGQMKQQMVADVKSRASRTSQLTHPLTDYVGHYHNDLLGNIDISIEQNSLAARMGYLHVVSTPFTEKDAIRVEMIPGQGEVVRFQMNSDGKIVSLVYSGLTFTRVAN